MQIEQKRRLLMAIFIISAFCIRHIIVSISFFSVSAPTNKNCLSIFLFHLPYIYFFCVACVVFRRPHFKRGKIIKSDQKYNEMKCIFLKCTLEFIQWNTINLYTLISVGSNAVWFSDFRSEWILKLQIFVVFFFFCIILVLICWVCASCYCYY